MIVIEFTKFTHIHVGWQNLYKVMNLKKSLAKEMCQSPSQLKEKKVILWLLKSMLKLMSQPLYKMNILKHPLLLLNSPRPLQESVNVTNVIYVSRFLNSKEDLPTIGKLYFVLDYGYQGCRKVSNITETE